MDSITEFKKEFSRSLRGYNTEEVDEAVEMLVSYSADLESANAEFAEANDWLTAENDRLTGEIARMTEELSAVREKMGDAGAMLAEARRSADQIIAAAEAEAERIRAERTVALELELNEYAARCSAERERYAALCRRTRALADEAGALYRDQLAALDLLAANQENEDIPPIAEAETPKARPIPRVRRRAVMTTAENEQEGEKNPDAPAVLPPTEEKEEKEPEAVTIDFEQLPPPVAIPEPTFEPEFAAIFTEESRPREISVEEIFGEETSRVDAVYRTANPMDLKVTRDTPKRTGSQTHNFSAVRRSLDEIGSRLK